MTRRRPRGFSTVPGWVWIPAALGALVVVLPVLGMLARVDGGGFLGLISSVGLTIVSPSVWEATLGNPKGSALFPYTSPALFSMTIGFVGIWLRRSLVETEQFEENAEKARATKHPLMQTIKHHPKSVVQLCAITLLSTLSYYTFFSALTPFANGPAYAAASNAEGNLVGSWSRRWRAPGATRPSF